MEAPDQGAAEALVRRTAALARLSIEGEEARRLGADFGRILGAFERLEAFDVPASGPEGPGVGQEQLRPDEPRDSLARDAVLENAPETEEGFYRVPRTVGGEP